MVTTLKNNIKNITLVAVLFVIFGGIAYLQFQQVKPQSAIDSEIVSSKTLLDKQDKAQKYETAKEITTPNGFINIDSLSIADLVAQKKVVLVDFWTYSCINCQRTLPYLKAWDEKYRDDGLVIVGLHTPEFKFEEDYDNVLSAVEKFGIKYPVVLDNDYSTWQAYKNRYWPRKYLIDIDGFIVYDHIGEGGYEETEKQIQLALSERAVALQMEDLVSREIADPEKDFEVDFSQVKAPETYFGASRNITLANGVENQLGQQTLREPQKTTMGKLYLSGLWDFQEEFAENKSASAKIIMKYSAKSVYLVASADSDIKITVLRDGQPLDSSSVGRDISDPQTSSTIIQNEQLYRLIEDDSYGEHIIEILIENPGLQAFAFTFG